MLRSIVAGLLVLVSTNLSADAISRPDQATESAAIQWLTKSVHTFTSESPSDDQLQPIVAALSGARVVGIGEATHGSHEDQAFKAELMKALIRAHRADVLVLELNRQVGFDLDAYVTGHGGDLPVLVRSPSFFRTWRDDEFTGLLLWLRAWNLQADHPVRVLGVDDQDAGVDADLALRFVAAREPATADRLRSSFPDLLLPGAASQRFSLWATNTNKEQYARATQTATELNALFMSRRDAWSGSSDFAEAAYAAQTALQGLAVFALDNGRGDVDKAGPAYLSRRDQFMASNLLQRLGTRSGMVWAHDLHLIADMPPTGSFPAGSTWMGRELHRALGAGYQNVTFSWSTGSFRAQTLSDNSSAAGMAHRTAMVPQALQDDRVGEVGHVLSQVGPDRFWVDLRRLPDVDWAKAFGTTPYYRGWQGWGVDPKTWQTDPGDKTPLRPSMDILVWFRKITPSHMLPGDDY